MTSAPSLYEESSQYRHWRFSPSELWEIRQSCNTSAIKRIRENIEQDKKARTIDESDNNKEPDYLTADEQVKLCRYYEQQLQIICAFLKLPNTVMATGVIYMKRFFLRNTAMDYHPKDVLLTCLFLATKVESERISIEEFGKNLRLPNTDMILQLEFTVSQGLQFEYFVHHPYRAAYGYFLDVQYTKEGQLDPTIDMGLLKETYGEVNNIIKRILLTDLPFIYQPAQLAIAAFIIAGKNNGFDLRMRTYLEHHFDKELSDTLYTMTILIDEALEENAQVPKDIATEIDLKLRSCMNPATNSESAL
ncbi:cyclin-like protein [Cunninghamella echinulata]|nr:cyclin-like protein [Cunninghamella echinulata]